MTKFYSLIGFLTMFLVVSAFLLTQATRAELMEKKKCITGNGKPCPKSLV